MCRDIRSSFASIISQQLLRTIGTALLDAASGEINPNERPRNRQICPFMPAQSRTHTHAHKTPFYCATVEKSRNATSVVNTQLVASLIDLGN